MPFLATTNGMDAGLSLIFRGVFPFPFYFLEPSSPSSPYHSENLIMQVVLEFCRNRCGLRGGLLVL